MPEDQSKIVAVLLDVKEQKGLDIDDQLIKACYEVQKKFQFDPNRSTVEKMRNLVEASLKKDGEQ